jgi:hypothetical protein
MQSTHDVPDFAPSNVFCHKWIFGDTFGKCEAEEIAARMVAICQEKDIWTGVTCQEIITHIQKDVALEQVFREKDRRNAAKMQFYQSTLRRRWKLTLFTLGIYGLCTPPIPKPVLETVDSILSFAYMPNFLGNGVFKLLGDGYIRAEGILKGADSFHSDDNPTFFLTEKFFKKITQRGWVQPAEVQMV